MGKIKFEPAHTAENLEIGEAVLIQKSLLPREPLCGPNLEVTYLMRTFSDVGGDFLDYFFLGDGKLGIYIGDVVGKGLSAAMYGALAAGGLRAIHKTGADPASVLELFNKRLRVRPIASRYCSTQYAVFDPLSQELAVANAGLPRPLHLSLAGCQPIGEGGLPSGLVDGATYEMYRVQLAPGDAVLFTTDGLSEAQDAQGEPLDMDGLIELCAVLDYGLPDAFLRSLFDSIEQFTDGLRSDDMTAALLKLHPTDGSRGR
jgi:phosphoserine phosphatase RsbU/P